MSDFDSIDNALKDIKVGKMVLVVDDMSEETEGDIIMAAELVTPEDINFMSCESRGLIAVAGTSERIEELDLEIIGLKTNTLRGIQFGVTIDAIPGTTTGASSKDRATTIDDNIARQINVDQVVDDIVGDNHEELQELINALEAGGGE